MNKQPHMNYTNEWVAECRTCSHYNAAGQCVKTPIPLEKNPREWCGQWWYDKQRGIYIGNAFTKAVAKAYGF